MAGANTAEWRPGVPSPGAHIRLGAGLALGRLAKGNCPPGEGDGVRPRSGKKINQGLEHTPARARNYRLLKILHPGASSPNRAWGRGDSVTPKNFTHTF